MSSRLVLCPGSALCVLGEHKLYVQALGVYWVNIRCALSEH